MSYRFVPGLLLLFILSACMPHPFHPERSLVAAAPGQALQQLRVQAEGRVEATPNQLRLRLGVITEAADAGEAVTENNQRMTRVMALLDDLGLERKDLATGQFQIQPQWSQPPRPTPASWQREIIGYRVSNDLWIRTSRIDLAGQLLGLAHQTGVNQVGNLQFTIADQDNYQQQAMTLATEKALRQAQVLATAAGAELGNILSLTLDTPGGFGGGAPLMAEARLMTATDAVPVTPGNVDIQATVTIVFELISPARNQ
ncbi:MAG: SIMPL domain-containing protein [Desulfuromonadales bacterium]|nr:SIMPL domain-containing protein [Desulfuromonadales bacterium]